MAVLNSDFYRRRRIIVLNAEAQSAQRDAEEFIEIYFFQAI